MVIFNSAPRGDMNYLMLPQAIVSLPADGIFLNLRQTRPVGEGNVGEVNPLTPGVSQPFTF